MFALMPLWNHAPVPGKSQQQLIYVARLQVWAGLLKQHVQYQ